MKSKNFNISPFVNYDAFKNVERSMSSGRKIFRFLKWIEDIKTIFYYIVYKDTSLRNIFKALMSLSSFFYHIFDNLVWSNNVGLIGEYFVGDIKLKNAKNLFSLLRNIIKIIMDFYKFKSLYYLNKKNEEEVSEVFEKRVENFQTEINNKVLKQTLEIRSKLRNKILDLFHSFLRINMLLYSLRLDPAYSQLHPIFIGLCGMLHSIISLYKIFVESNNMPINNNKEKKSTLHILIEENEFKKEKIFDKNYFDDYYLDFNKDFPVDPKNIISIRTVNLFNDINII
jgi:hypothetical protein